MEMPDVEVMLASCDRFFAEFPSLVPLRDVFAIEPDNSAHHPEKCSSGVNRKGRGKYENRKTFIDHLGIHTSTNT